MLGDTVAVANTGGGVETEGIGAVWSISKRPEFNAQPIAVRIVRFGILDRPAQDLFVALFVRRMFVRRG